MESFREMSKEELQAQEVEVNKKYQEFKDLHLSLNMARGKPAPDHATIARFLSVHFSQCSKKTLAEVTEVLLDIGEISGVQVFIDGTKMESVAGRYTFVWKKAVTKFQNRLAERIAIFVEGLELSYGICFIFNGTKFGIRILKKIRKRLYWIKEEEGIIFVHGCGKRQSKLQKDIKELENYLAKYKEYNQKIHTCGERSSYSKTDNDATFMRMKEDHLGTGQLEKHQKMAKKKTYEYG